MANEWKVRQVLPALPAEKPSPEKPPTAHPAAPLAAAAAAAATTTPPPAAASLLTQPPAPTNSTTAAPSATNLATSARTQPLPQPAAAPALRPLSIRPKSPSPEVDVDGERGSLEPEASFEEEARDDESQAIVAQLERGLPRWEGLEDVGWSDNIPQVSSPP